VRLVGLTAGQIRQLAAGSPVEVDGAPLEWPADDRRVLRYRTEALAADPASAPYLLHVLLDDAGSPLGRFAGRIGCHEGPQDGVLEIGYYVSPGWRGRGVATRMVSDFLGWLGPRGVRRVRAAVRPDNVASLAVLAHFGFEQVGDQWDDEDGLELLYEAPVPDGPDSVHS
jgi:ribosomal-protein-alanine N-acetyltransferase